MDGTVLSNTIQPRGAKADSSRKTMRQQFDWSDRTFDRWWKAMSIIQSLGLDCERVILDCTRPSGQINVSKMERIAEGMLLMASQKAHE